jgi:hypothetical protein
MNGNWLRIAVRLVAYFSSIILVAVNEHSTRAITGDAIYLATTIFILSGGVAIATFAIKTAEAAIQWWLKRSV